MPDDERMSIDERRKYLRLVAPRCAKAGRVERSGLLTEIVAVTGLYRKSEMDPMLRTGQGQDLNGVRRHPLSISQWPSQPLPPYATLFT